jgi:hypothetical protein
MGDVRDPPVPPRRSLPPLPHTPAGVRPQSLPPPVPGPSKLPPVPSFSQRPVVPSIPPPLPPPAIPRAPSRQSPSLSPPPPPARRPEPPPSISALEDEPDEPTAFFNRPSASRRDPAPLDLPSPPSAPPGHGVELHSLPTQIINRPMELRPPGPKPAATPLPPVMVAAHAISLSREPLVSDPFAEARARRAKRLRGAAIGAGGGLALLGMGYLLGRAQTPAGSAAPREAADTVAKQSVERAETRQGAEPTPGAREAPASAVATTDEIPDEPPPPPAQKSTHSSSASHRGASASAHAAAEAPASPPPHAPPLSTNRGFISPIRSPGF